MVLPRDSMPDWLRTWGARSRFDAGAFFASRTVCYPGAGFDGQPVKFFASRQLAHCFVYVDYLITQEAIERQLADQGQGFRGYSPYPPIRLGPSDLTPSGWRPRFLHEQEMRPPLFEPVAPYAFLQILERQAQYDETHGPMRLAILFLAADAIASYEALFCRDDRTAPYGMVIQDHGFGGNWTRFDAVGALSRLAVRASRLPSLLLVASNSRAWDGYREVPGEWEDVSRWTRRQLFERR
jgi:hypothetical protein